MLKQHFVIASSQSAEIKKAGIAADPSSTWLLAFA
jgi:hypothetical protein